MQSAQLTVAFCAVDDDTFGSCMTVTDWPPPAHIPAFSDQHGAMLPFEAQAGTVASMKPPVPFDVWLMTVQSGSCVPGLFATWPLMQGGCSEALMSCAILSSDGAKLLSQIDSTRPFEPNSFTNWETRTPGSAKLLSAAMH